MIAERRNSFKGISNLKVQPPNSASQYLAHSDKAPPATLGLNLEHSGPEETFEPSRLPIASTLKPSFPAEQIAKQVLNIQAPAETGADSQEKLKCLALEAIAYFKEHYGPVNEPVSFALGSETSALRTGYSFDTNVINFPDLQRIKNCGLDSEDVIRHEIFHALMHQAYPSYCTQEKRQIMEVEALQEALADHFAYRLSPDRAFGEKYYKNQAQMRLYDNELHLGLTSGAHGQGNAITKLMIRSELKGDDIRSFLESGNFSLDGLAKISPTFAENLRKDQAIGVEQKIAAYPKSAQDKYWLESDKPLELGFIANQALSEQHKDFRVSWLDKEGNPSRSYIIEETSPNTFNISSQPGAKIEKVIARFLDGDKVIGFRPFYFGVRD